MSFNPFVNGGGGTSSEDKVARAEIAAIKDGENLDSFSDVETALDNKANITDILSLDANKLDKTGTAAKAIADSAGNNIITTYAKKTDLDDLVCTYRGTYNTLEGLEAAAGDINDYAFYQHMDADGNSVFDKYKFVPTEQVELPEGYTQLEYIESSGTQYIDTGVNLSSSRGFYMKFMPLTLTNYTTFFGLHGFDNRNYSVNYKLLVNNSEMNLQYVGYTRVNIVANEISEIDFKPLNLSVNGSVTTVSQQGDWYFSGTNTAALFAYKEDSNFYGKSYMRLYECKMYDSDSTTLLRHFIPCKNASNAIGLYDLVDGTFYANQGTGAFIAGPQANGYWEYEYTLSNLTLTTTQFAALNSGINTIKVNQIETNKNNIVNIKDGTNIDSFSDVEAALSDKVDKETGKGLSTNDYTTAEKTKLAGIAEGAEVNVQSNWTQTTTTADDYIKNKPTLGTAAEKNATDTYNATGTDVTTGKAVAAALATLPEPMVFKGSLGTGGTITTLPTASSSNKGYVYKVITAGTYASQSAKVGDTFISDGSAWVLIPSGDEPSGTVTNVAVANGGGLTVSGSPITSSGTITVGHSNSVTAKTSSSVKKFTYDEYGHVTGSSELSTAESNALASGIDSEKVEQIETNKNNIFYNEQDGFLRGKNYSPIEGGTVTESALVPNYTPIYLPIGSYTISFNATNFSGSAEFRVYNAAQTRVVREFITIAASNSFNFTINEVGKSYYLYFNQATVTNLMIRKQGTTDTFEPYAMSNAELTQTIGDINTVLEEVL